MRGRPATSPLCDQLPTRPARRIEPEHARRDAPVRGFVGATHHRDGAVARRRRRQRSRVRVVARPAVHRDRPPGSRIPRRVEQREHAAPGPIGPGVRLLTPGRRCPRPGPGPAWTVPPVTGNAAGAGTQAGGGLGRRHRQRRGARVDDDGGRAGARVDDHDRRAALQEHRTRGGDAQERHEQEGGGGDEDQSGAAGRCAARARRWRRGRRRRRGATGRRVAGRRRSAVSPSRAAAVRAQAGQIGEVTVQLGELGGRQAEVEGARGELEGAVVQAAGGAHGRTSVASRMPRSSRRARHSRVRVAPSVRPSRPATS